MNPLGNAKNAMLQRAASQITPSEHPIGKAFATVFARIEDRQEKALASAFARTDVDVEYQETVEERRDELLELVDAVAGGDFESYWWNEKAPLVLEKPEKAREYVGLDGDEWHDQLRRWYRSYHDAGVVETPLEDLEERGRLAEVADRHIRETYGCSLQDFVEDVINWSAQRAGRQLVAGRIEQHTELIGVLADEIEARNRRIEELETRLEDVEQ